jgi:hypothetical protein
MPMLTAADVADLRDMFTDAQVDHSLTLKRYNQNTDQYDTITVQGVQIAYPARQPRTGGVIGTEQSLVPVTLYREAPFDVYVGDTFSLDGRKGGTIRSVYPDPVLGVIIAEADIETGVA